MYQTQHVIGTSQHPIVPWVKDSVGQMLPGSVLKVSVILENFTIRWHQSNCKRSMNNFEVFVYFVCFALIGGAAFAMMWSNIQSINIEMSKPVRKPKHPEAPEAGEEVMYVDLTRERLEGLYNKIILDI